MSVLVKIRCTQERLNFIRKPPLAAGDVQATRIQWTFCDAWRGYMKTALFSRKKKGGKIFPMIIQNDECLIPREVLNDRGRFYISVIGDKDGIRLTSNMLEYEVNPSLAASEILPSDPTPDVYAQIMNMLNRKADNITYDSEDSTIQLVANDMPIGDKIKVSTNGGNGVGITNVLIDENGDLIVVFDNGTQQNAGRAKGKDGAVYVPHLDAYKVLTFTIEEEPAGVPDPCDLNPHDEWSTPEDEGKTQYIWETL